MAVDYTLVVAFIGVPIAMLVMKYVGVLALMYEIVMGLWMLPI